MSMTRTTKLLLVSLGAVLGLACPGLAQEKPAEGPAPPNVKLRFKRFLSGTETCLTCHGDYNIITTRGAHKNESLWVNAEDFLGSVHSRLGCVSCHTNIESHGHQLSREITSPGEKSEIKDVPPGIDAGALAALDAKVGGRIKREPALVACVKCHPEIFKVYITSVHGNAVIGQGNSDPPYCIDCHGWHYIKPSSDPRALTNPANVPNTCKRCHAQTEIRRRYGLTKNVVETFGESFHARRSEMGRGEIAVCTSCHGWHDIYAPSDPRSKVNKARVSETCGECHQGAQINFASAFTHGEVSRTELVGIYAVTQTHKWMIVGIIGPLVFLVFVHLIKTLRERAALKRLAEHE